VLCKSHTIACHAGHACSVQIESACHRNFSQNSHRRVLGIKRILSTNCVFQHETRTFDYEPGGQFLTTLFWRSASYLLHFEKRNMASGRACGCTQRVRISLDESAPQQKPSTGILRVIFGDLLFLPTLDCWAVRERGAAPPCTPRCQRGTVRT